MTSSVHPAGTLCWFECGSTDAGRSKAFYTELFGWNAEETPMPGGEGSYTVLKVGGEDIAGLYLLAGPQFKGVPSHWMTYVAVDDVDATLERSKSLGGTVIAPAMDIPNVGRIAVLKDPTGAVISVAHFDQHPGTSPNGPFGWSELATRDTGAAQSFYTALFTWDAKPDPKNAYTEFQTGGRSIAGMMAMKPEHGSAPPHWLPYMTVADCDDVVTRATKLGATVYVPPTDIPDVGRFAVFADPTGATLGIVKLLRH